MTWPQIVFWHWWACGVLLLIVELLAPGMFFIWMAEAAFLVGIVLLASPGLSWEIQLILFSVLSVLSIGVFRRFLRKHPIETDQPLLNQRAARYVGRVFVLDQPIVNGRGRLRVDDSSWKIEGDDCDSGTRVKVTGADGVVLRVAPAE